MLFLEILLCLVGLIAWIALGFLAFELFGNGAWGWGLLASACMVVSLAAAFAFTLSRTDSGSERPDGCYRLHHVSEPVVIGKTITETSNPVYDPIPCPAS